MNTENLTNILVRINARIKDVLSPEVDLVRAANDKIRERITVAKNNELTTVILENDSIGRRVGIMKRMTPESRRDEIKRLRGIMSKNNDAADLVVDEVKRLDYLFKQISKHRHDPVRCGVLVSWAEQELKEGLVFSESARGKEKYESA